MEERVSHTRCSELAEAINDLVDGALGPEAQRTLEAHFEICPRCRVLRADLETIRQAAAALGRVVPSAGGWERVAARLPPHQAARRRLMSSTLDARFARPAWGWLAAAAALLVVTTASVLLWLPGGDVQPPRTSDLAASAVEPPSIESVEAELELATAHYEKAIAGLEAIIETETAVLDPQVSAALERALMMIDEAVAESRAALRGEPGNRVARDSLFAALHQKVSLLEDVIVLMGEMRMATS